MQAKECANRLIKLAQEKVLLGELTVAMTIAYDVKQQKNKQTVEYLYINILSSTQFTPFLLFNIIHDYASKNNGILSSSLSPLEGPFFGLDQRFIWAPDTSVRNKLYSVT